MKASAVDAVHIVVVVVDGDGDVAVCCGAAVGTATQQSTQSPYAQQDWLLGWGPTRLRRPRASALLLQRTEDSHVGTG